MGGGNPCLYVRRKTIFKQLLLYIKRVVNTECVGVPLIIRSWTWCTINRYTNTWHRVDRTMCTHSSRIPGKVTTWQVDLIPVFLLGDSRPGDNIIKYIIHYTIYILPGLCKVHICLQSSAAYPLIFPLYTHTHLFEKYTV